MTKKNQNKKKQYNPQTRALIWGICDKVVALMPILFLAIIKWNEYFSTKTAFNNIVAFVMIGAFVGIILSKKTEILKGVWGFYAFFITAYALRSIVTDIVLISGVACIGVTVSALWTTPKKKKWEKLKDKTENAEINANTIMNLFKQQNQNKESGDISGRV